jgi:hypothetical protein
MAWRVVEHGAQRWQVSVAAERRADSRTWGLILSFRSAEPAHRAFWAEYPLHSPSRAALFAQAEQISDESLAAFLAEHVD